MGLERRLGLGNARGPQWAVLDERLVKVVTANIYRSWE